MLAFMLVYFAGIASCGIQGAKKTNDNAQYTPHPITLELCSAFGGGLIRDLFILRVYPTVFTMECLPDIMVALTFGTMYLWLKKNKHIHKILLQLAFLADACGLGTFIAIGSDKAIRLEAPIFTIFLCGVFTSLGGGVLSSVLCGVAIRDVLDTSVLYRLTAAIGSILYPFWVKTAGIDAAHAIIVFYTTIGVCACNQNVRTCVKKVMLKSLDLSILNTYWMLLVIIAIRIQHNHIVEIKYMPQKFHNSTIYLCERKKLTLILHRIRQM